METKPSTTASIGPLASVMERRGLGSVALTLKDSVARRVELPELDHVVGRPNLEQIYFVLRSFRRLA